MGVGGADDEAHHVTAEILLSDDPIGIKFMIGLDRGAAPHRRRVAQRPVGEHVAVAVVAKRGNHNADFVGALVVLAGGA